MAFKLLLKEEANSDIVKAYFYYESKRTGLGDQFIQSLQSYFERLQEFPELFPKKYGDFRESVINRFPYVIIYRIEDDVVYILSIFNTWLNPKRKPQ